MNTTFVKGTPIHQEYPLLNEAIDAFNLLRTTLSIHNGFMAGKEVIDVNLVVQYSDKKPGHWDNDPEHGPGDWQYEVGNGDTRLGYHEWVQQQKELRMMGERPERFKGLTPEEFLEAINKEMGVSQE